MNLMPHEVEYTLTRHPVHPSMLKLMKPCMIGMLTSKNIFPMGPQLASKLTHNHCEVNCNMIIFMLCHCVVDYSDVE